MHINAVAQVRHPVIYSAPAAVIPAEGHILHNNTGIVPPWLREGSTSQIQVIGSNPTDPNTPVIM